MQLVWPACVAYLSLTTPVFAVLYWLVSPHHRWSVVLAVHLCLTVAFGVLAVSARRARIWIDGSAVTERGLFGWRHTVAVGRISSALMLDMYEPGALDTHPQLFLLDAEGHRLLRMRGQLWSRIDMEALPDELGVPVVRLPKPMTRRDVNRTYPGLLYWFER